MEERIFDFGNHYSESEDALTRHQDRALGDRGELLGVDVA